MISKMTRGEGLSYVGLMVGPPMSGIFRPSNIVSATAADYQIYHIDRGYEKIEQKFLGLGADIQRIS